MAFQQRNKKIKNYSKKGLVNTIKQFIFAPHFETPTRPGSSVGRASPF